MMINKNVNNVNINKDFIYNYKENIVVCAYQLNRFMKRVIQCFIVE